ncbi:hypothetical protein DFH06DRAFT_1257833 [Mycena polygramma]|nr:hypothetical protein DFH06DRAFT_1257833 [Mycena polygramma]
MQNYTVEDFEGQFITVSVAGVVIRPPMSEICPTLEQRRWVKIIRAMIVATERNINFDNTESPWDAPWRHVGEWIGVHRDTEMFAQKRIWNSQYRRVGFQPTKTIAAPAKKYTKTEIPDLTGGQLISLEDPSGQKVPWLHVHGFIELKRALSRKRSETINGIPLTGPALGRLHGSIVRAAAQVERQAALHFSQLHNRLRQNPEIIDNLPHAFYVIATAGHWFAVGLGSDPFYRTEPAIAARARAIVKDLLNHDPQTLEEEEEDDGEEEEEGHDDPNGVPIAPAWSDQELAHTFKTKIAIDWAPRIYHLNDPNGWKVLNHVRNMIGDDLKDIKDCKLFIPAPMVP